MDAPELRKLIERLQTEIRATQSADEKEQAMLVQLDAEIHEFLGRSGKRETIPPTTVKRLEEALHQFEATHPTLTNLISQLLEDLSSAGL